MTVGRIGGGELEGEGERMDDRDVAVVQVGCEEPACGLCDCDILLNSPFMVDADSLACAR